MYIIRKKKKKNVLSTRATTMIIFMINDVLSAKCHPIHRKDAHAIIDVLIFIYIQQYIHKFCRVLI